MLFKSLARTQIDGGRTWFNRFGPRNLSGGISFPLPTEQLAVLIHPVFRAFDRTANPGYGHCEIEKHPQATERLNRGDARFLRHERRMRSRAARHAYTEIHRGAIFPRRIANRGNICWTIAGLSSANEVFGCK
jgi:hypothetical protein